LAITPEQVDAAQAVQHEAGRDTGSQVRLVAGPGTGKSSTIEERVRWLLESGAEPEAVVAVSFTRASAFDLRGRVHGYCLTNRQPQGADVAVTTLHSLALRTLRAAGALQAYPADPLVVDDWELRNVFEAEFGHEAGIGSLTRREEIRRDHEAYWSTGQYNPPNLVPPDPPISDAERERFARFHRPRSQTYSCVLPGEIVRKCVERMEAGTLDPTELLAVDQLIVDEFQDLNPMDLAFVKGMAESEATLFVAGDDDQSLYSFRFASPSGIQNFLQDYPDSSDYALEACFRCTPAVLGAGRSLIESNRMDGRLPKDQVSLYADADPPIDGGLGCWRYRSGRREADGIAESCKHLIEAGLNAHDILILLSNQRAQGPELYKALEAAEVPFERPRETPFRDSQAGRLVFAVVRLAAEPHDYMAHRLILGLRRGVGVGTCSDIARTVIAENLNYRDLFYGPVSEDLFPGRQGRAISGAQDVIAEVNEWGPEDTLASRADGIEAIVSRVRGDDAVSEWLEYVDGLPAGMNLSEIRGLLMLDKQDQQSDLLIDVYRRLGEDPPDDIHPRSVRIMSMHGAKGLSARVVMIPGLEEEILPGPRRRPYPGLVLEAARMLYVSITRARLACILSFAATRFMNGRNQQHNASRFTTDLGQAFESKEGGVSSEKAAEIVEQVGLL